MRLRRSFVRRKRFHKDSLVNQARAGTACTEDLTRLEKRYIMHNNRCILYEMYLNRSVGI